MKIYLVGGAVRDKLLNYPSIENDWVVVGGSSQAMIKQGYVPVGKDFPVFLHPKTKEEYALARRERKVAAGYSGFTFDTGEQVSLEQDLARRDLSINAIAQDNNGELIDPYGGISDIQRRCLRHVSPAFIEDPLRILRVARFAARYHHLGFNIAPETKQLMRSIVDAGEIQHLVAERVWKECEKALGERNPEIFFHVLKECGALTILMPEIASLIESPHADQAINSLKRATKLSPKIQCRIAALSQTLSAEQINTFYQGLACPNSVSELASLSHQHHKAILELGRANGEQLHALLKATDAHRRPERLEDILIISKACYQASQHSALNFAEANLLLTALKIEANINAKTLVKQGLKGPQIGQELAKKRIAALENFAVAHQQTLSIYSH